jgi:hypothetical protein
MKRFIYLLCLVALLSSCSLDTEQGRWELVTVTGSVYNGNNWTITVNYNGDLYDFYSTTDMTDSCWVFICNGKILDIRR